jgi:NAD(P)-dependent dehydrogenase (short-subunit alcohol dehydrogenase family)
MTLMTPTTGNQESTQMQTVEGPLAGRIALVTGGSRGLGREMVLAFAAAGADVAIVSRKLDSCERLAEQVREQTGRRASAHSAHVGDWDAIPRLLDEVEAELGGYDVLVNNAGIAPLYPDLESVSEELFDKVIDVNLKGPFRLMALAGARMVRRGGGSIINISSIAAARPSTTDLPYAAAKAALQTVSAGFAQALGPTVRVNTIMAGPFYTDISKAWDLDAFEEAAASYPLRRGGRPDEIVGAALYFASDASSYTTGAVLPVDGGRTVIP